MRPKTSMVEGYLKDECIGFVMEHLARKLMPYIEEYGMLKDKSQMYMMTMW